MAKYEGKFSGTYTEYVLDKKYPGMKIGDKVDYNEGTVNQYEFKTDTTKGMGASATKNEETKKYDLTAGTYKTEDLSWRVLGINDEGQIELISETPHSVKVTLANEEGYYNGADELDKLCNALYGKGTGAATEKGARSLKVTDINKLANYDPTSDPRYFRYVKYRFTSEGAYDYSESTDGKTNWSDWNSIPSYYGVSCFKMIGETEPMISSTKAGETEAIKNTRYNYDAGAKIKREISENVANLFVDSDYQWLASTCVDPNDVATYWGMFFLSDGFVWTDSFYYSGVGYGSSCRGFRPVITLSSDVSIKYNSTAQEWQIK